MDAGNVRPVAERGSGTDLLTLTSEGPSGSLTNDRWFVVLSGAIYTVNFVDRTIMSVLGEPIRRDLALSDLQLGAVGGLAFALFYGAVGIPLARLAERYSRVAIIAGVTAIWSLMTVLCGMAVGFASLLLCRMGVGIGEAGFTPALVSTIADRFPPQRRAAAFSLIAVGAPLGGAIAALLGGIVAQRLGWRWAFAAVGAPGLILAALFATTVGEPARDDEPDAGAPPFGAVLHRLARSRAFVLLTAASGLVGLVGFGLSLFLIPFLVRRYGLALPEAGLVFVASFSFATAVGTVAGGLVADRLGRRDVRWFGWAPAGLVAVAIPCYVAAALQRDWRVLIVLMFVATSCLYAFLPTIMTVTQRLVESRMRASAAAIHAFGQTVAGLGIGSVLLGYLSDRLAAATYGAGYAHDCIARLPLASGSGACAIAAAAGLQRALLSLAVVLAAAALVYLASARAIARELATSKIG